MGISDLALNSAVRLVERLERELAANPIEAMQRNPGAWSAQARVVLQGSSFGIHASQLSAAEALDTASMDLCRPHMRNFLATRTCSMFIKSLLPSDHRRSLILDFRLLRQPEDEDSGARRRRRRRSCWRGAMRCARR